MDQVVVEFIADTSQLKPATDQLEQLGAIDSGTAAIFTKTNQALQQRNQLLAESLKNQSLLTVSVDSQQAIYNKLVTSVKNLSGASKETVQNLLKMSTGQVAQGFKEAAVNVDDFIEALEGAGKSTNQLSVNHNTLRTQLQQTKNALAELTAQQASGTALTAEQAVEFDQLALKAGKLSNALQQSNVITKNLASDAPLVNAFAEGINGLAGAFQAAVGASALFGDDNKDLQQTLVKVTAVTAIAQGIQQSLNLVRKEGALATAILVTQEKLLAVSVALETAAQSDNIIVSKAATVAQYALNFAMEANPIGIVVVALAAFISILIQYTSNAKLAAEATAQLDAALASSGANLDAQIQGIKKINDEALADLDARNAKESEKTRQQATALVAIQRQRADEIQELESQIQSGRLSTNKDVIAKVAEAEKQLVKLQNDQYQDDLENYKLNAKGKKEVDDESLAAAKANADARVSLAVKNSSNSFAAQRQLANAEAAIEIKAAGDNEEQINAVRAKLHRQLIDINQAQDAEAEKVRQAKIQDGLLETQIESRRINSFIADDETAIQIQAIKDRVAFEIRAEGLKHSQIVAIQKQGQKDIEQLQRDQLQRDITQSIQNQEALNNVVLDGVKATDAERLDLEIQNVLLQQGIDLAAQDLTEQKRQQIIAKSEKTIRDLKLAALNQETEDQLRLNKDQFTAANTELQRQLDAQDQIRSSNRPKQTAQILAVPILNLQQQKDQIDELTQYQLKQNGIKLDANQSAFEQDLISAKQYNQTSEDLTADNTAIFEAGEEKKRQATLKTTEFQQQMNKKILQTTLQGVSDGLSILSQFYAQQDQAANDRLAKQKQNVQDELDAGTITAKAAAERNKELDAQEKALKIQQARRNKELAIFQAIIGTAQAVVAALEAPPPLGFISAAIAGAIGAAQIALIVSQPLPQFKTGKKNAFEGFGIMGEAGSEILQTKGQQFLVDKPSVVWLGAQDKIYTPSETAHMMDMPSMNTTAPVIEMKPRTKDFDYDRMGKAVAENMPDYSLSIDGYKEFIKQGQSFTTRLNTRRKWL